MAHAPGLLLGPEGHPLTLYHGSHNCFDGFKGGCSYFTSRADYRFIRLMPYVYVVNLIITNPRFVDAPQIIERLRSFPDSVAQMQADGYDAVIYANPDNLLKGASGWGDDCPQFCVFSPEQIRLIRRIDPKKDICRARDAGSDIAVR